MVSGVGVGAGVGAGAGAGVGAGAGAGAGLAQALITGVAASISTMQAPPTNANNFPFFISLLQIVFYFDRLNVHAISFITSFGVRNNR